MKIDFDELDGWEEFENLVAGYFRESKALKANQVIDVKVVPSGNGPDGGRDILVICRVDDSITTFDRKWVIQCKFQDQMLKKSHLDKVNITSLIQEYDACGYLLITKNAVHVGVTTQFENLKKKCKYDFEYEIWNGHHFRQKLTMTSNLHQSYFPKYHQYISKHEAELKRLKLSQKL